MIDRVSTMDWQPSDKIPEGFKALGLDAVWKDKKLFQKMIKLDKKL